MNTIRKKNHEKKVLKLKKRLKRANEKKEERLLRWEIFKTYLPSFSINKLNIKFTKLSVIISFLAICTYTIAAFILQKYTSTEISSTLTVSFFAFFGTELVAVTTIKNKETKLKESFDSTNIEYEDVGEENYV